LFGVYGNGVFQIEDDRIAIERPGLFECTYVGARHIQDRAPRSISHYLPPGKRVLEYIKKID
jgi:hypothetical protein